LRRLARRHRRVAAAIDRASALAILPKLTASGLLDFDWYSALAGEDFEDLHAAGRHYLTVGRRQGLTPNPLFIPALWTTGNWRASLRDPVVTYLRNANTISPHMLFDPVTYLAAQPGAANHVGGPLGHFLSGSASVELPVSDPVLRPGRPWAEVREAMLAVAAIWHETIQLTRPRRTSDYNAVRGREVLKNALARPGPIPTDARPVVSIITPTRNRQVEIAVAIRSVQAQTLGDWEMVVVDDGSDDDTASVVEAIAAKDSRVRLIRQEQRGVSAARNAGLAQAAGKWVAFLDSDNRWAPEFLEAMVRELQATNALAAYSAVELSDGESTWVRYFEGSVEDLLFQNHIDLNALMIDRELLDQVGHFDESLRRMVDWDLVLRIVAVARLEHFPFIGVHYDDAPSPDRITTRESSSWADVVVGKHLIDWETAKDVQRLDGLTSVVIVAGASPLTTVRAVRSVLSSATDDEVEVVVVTSGVDPYHWGVLSATVEIDPRVRIVRLPRSASLALARNVGISASMGSTIAFLDASYVASPNWLAPLREELENPECEGAQALVLSDDGTVRTAGLGAPVGLDSPPFLLQGFSAVRLAESHRIPLMAVSFSAVAIRASTAIQAQGLNPFFSERWDDLDFCFRVAAGRTNAFVLRTDSQVTRGPREGEESPVERAKRANYEEFQRHWTLEAEQILTSSSTILANPVAPTES